MACLLVSVLLDLLGHWLLALVQRRRLLTRLGGELAENVPELVEVGHEEHVVGGAGEREQLGGVVADLGADADTDQVDLALLELVGLRDGQLAVPVAQAVRDSHEHAWDPGSLVTHSLGLGQLFVRESQSLGRVGRA